MVAVVPASLLPAVILSIEKTEVAEISDMEDEHRVSLVLTYIADMRKDFEASHLIKAGFNKVTEALIGRETSDYKLKTDSILHLLRNNLNVDAGKELRTEVSGVSVVTPDEIATGRIEGYWSAEGTIRFTAHFIQER